MENGFDSLLVSEGQLTVGLKAISAAQNEGGAPVEFSLLLGGNREVIQCLLKVV